jgi:hypothetical protein
VSCFDSNQVSVTSTATLVHTFPSTGTQNFAYTAAVANMSETDTVFLGSSNSVTTSTGFPVGPGERYEFDIYPDGTSNQSTLYAVTESATVTVAWITGF